MDSAGFWEYHRKRISASFGIGLAIGSLISAGISWIQNEQINSIHTAFVLNHSTVDKLKVVVKANPQKRIHIKMSGRISADTPLQVQYSDASIHECVVKDEWDEYTTGWSEKKYKFQHSRTVADNPFLLVSPTAHALEGSRIKLSQSCFRDLKTAEVANEEHKLISSRIRTTVFGFFYMPYPYRHTHRTSATRVGTYHFATMDATLDQNDEIVLVKPCDPRKASVLAHSLEMDAIDERKTKRLNWALISAALGVLSLSSFGVGI
jgi:hypothetical protein